MIKEFFDVSVIELIAGIGYLIGHFFLAKGVPIGWLIKMLGGIGWSIFLYLNQNYIFMAVMIVITITMAYGFYKWNSGLQSKRTKIDKFFEILATLVAIFMIGRFLFTQTYAVGPIFETLIVIAELSGTMLLARKIIEGWLLLIVMGILVASLVIFINPDSAPLLGVLELLSIYYYVRGYRLMKATY